MEAGVDAIHVSTGNSFPHPRNPAGADLDVQLLGHTYVTPYDTLIVAAGAGQSYFGNDHFAEFAPGMKSIHDALELRARILGAFEQPERSSGQAERVHGVDHVADVRDDEVARAVGAQVPRPDRLDEIGR